MRALGLCLLLAAGTALAGESVVLTNGARLRIDRHETEGDRVRLYNSSGFIEINASLVSGFEVDETLPAPAPGPAQPVPAAPQAALKPAPSPAQMAEAAARKYGLPPALVRSVMAAESAFQLQAVSPKGAIGLMQLMPGTARDLGVDPQDPAQNVDGGTRLLRDLLLRYDKNLWHALAAYNAGPGAVDKSPGGLPPYGETLRYVNRIDRAFKAASAPAGAGSAPSGGTK